MSPDGREVYLRKMSISFGWDDFLKEYHDIYLLNTETLKIKLVKEKAVSHGAVYFIR